MKAKQFVLLCSLFIGKAAYTQTIYSMPVTGTQNVTACGGIFYDSGGNAGNYSNSENGVIVFCPALPGQYVMMQFTSITLNDAGDRLRIYSGSDTTGLKLFNVAGFTSSAGCGNTIISTDSSGCLTAHFISNSSGTGFGWKVLLYCIPSPQAMPPGTDCANPVVISSIPFTDSGQCTECMLNDYQSQTGICHTGYAGEDRVYQYTTTGPETVCITMSSTSGNPALAIYQGCPDAGGVCLSPTPMVGNDSMQFTFPGAGTYYLIVDESSGYSCYDLNIVSCIVGINEQENPEDGVFIFPNPVTNELKIKNAKFEIEKLEIYDAVGVKVLSTNVPLFSSRRRGLGDEVISTSSLLPGIYFLSLTDVNSRRVMKKFIKM